MQMKILNQIQLKDVLLLICLALCSYQDIKNRQIHIGTVIICTVLGSIIGYFEGAVVFGAVMKSLLPGIGMIIIAIISRQAIGIGDGIVILMIGIYEGLDNTIQIVLLSLGGCFIWAAFLYLVKKSSKDVQIPFIPFLAMGVVVRYFL